MIASRIVAVTLLSSALAAAQAPPEVTFRVDTKLAQIEVRARHRNGKSAANLTRDDFILEEDGKRHAIATFEYVGAPAPSSARPVIPVAGPSPDNPPPADPGDASTSPVRIYILTECQLAEAKFLYPAIREFIERQIPPGSLVSLGARPFTANRNQLLATLDEMAAHPLGRKDPETGDWLPGFYDETTLELASLERDRLTTVREALEFRFEDDLNPSGEETLVELQRRYNNHDANHPNIEMRPPRLRTIDSRIRALGRRELIDYLSIVRHLGAYPGKKIIVLFRSGLRLEPENMDLMAPIASEALRARVSFYTIDSRGLETFTVNATMGINPLRLIDNGDDQSTRAVLTRELRHRGQDTQYGLRVLADHTGGRAITNTNDFNDVFDAVVSDAYGYYLLGYYPRGDQENGRFRSINVRSTRRGIRVETGRGYFEPVSFARMSASQKALQLDQAILAGNFISELPLRAGHDLFRGNNGRPIVVFGVSAPVAELIARSSNGKDLVRFTVAARAERTSDGASWIYRSPAFRQESRPAASGTGTPSPAAWVDFTGQVPLPPGHYKWIVAIRNDADGRIGRYEGTLDIPDFSVEFTASTLLLAGQVVKPQTPADRGKPEKQPPGSVLQFHQHQVQPEYRAEFRPGQHIFFLYDLYNVLPEEISSPPPLRVILRRGTNDVENFSAVGDLETHPERRQLRYLGAIDTATLEPGSYNLLVYGPDHSRDDSPLISRDFTVTAQAAHP